jgi:pimeloyl-ACP methyl ester carboxylesterase
MSSGFVHFKNSKLHFTTLGNGPESLLMFHGFGQDNNSFYPLSYIISSQYTAYVFDLYFHGESQWAHGEKPLEKEHWKETLQQFFRENKINHFNLAGYSLGGKFALATFEAFPEKTKALILLAPDGIKTSFWYSLATYPLMLRKIFRSMIDYPERFQTIARLLHECGLVKKGVLKFAEFQMNSREKRARVYYSWVVFRHLKFNLKKIAGLINHHKVALTVVVGQYDQVIQPKNMERLLRNVNNYVFETPEVGHTGLIAASGSYFRKNIAPKPKQ